METRKIVKSGPSSYVVSLPSSWVKLNKLEKGNLLYLEQNNNTLVYSVRETQEESRAFTIEVDGKSSQYLEKMLKSAYLRNFNVFIFRGTDINDRLREFRKILDQLVAVEIMEQNSQRVVANFPI